jgi:uncharacterized membrane protein
MTDNNQETILGFNKLGKGLIFVIPMLVGPALGWFTPNIANLLIQLFIPPMEEILRIISSLNSFWVSVVAIRVGVLIGLVMTFLILHEALKSVCDEFKI